MYQLLLVIHMLICVCIVALVLVQQGKGAGMGASFGSGASQTVFGSRGSGSFLLKVTIAFAALFFSTSIILNRMATNSVKGQAVVELPVPATDGTAPVTPSSLPGSTNSAPVTQNKPQS